MLVTAIPSYYDGCWYYRCVMPGTPNGWMLPKRLGEEIDNDKALEMAQISDAVVFHRPFDDLRVNAIQGLKLKGKKIIFDNDDTYLPGIGIPIDKFTDKGKQIANVLNYNLYTALRESDLVFTTTEYLAKEYRKANPNVKVMPNYINPLEMEERIENDTDKKRIGLVGSVLSNDDYLHVKKQLRALAKDGHQIVIFGVKSPDGSHSKVYAEDVKFWDSLNPEWHPYTAMSNYYHTLNTLKLDVMLIPRQDSYFNRCKSNIKFLEASLMEIPVIAQGFKDGLSPYQVNKEDAKHMHIAIDNDDWYDLTTDLLKDDKRRKKMAKEAQEYVLKHYNINDHFHKWNDAIEQI